VNEGKVGGDKFGAFLEQIHQQREQADRQTNDWQRRIRPGEYCVTTIGDEEGLLIIHNEVVEDEEATPRDRKGYHLFVRAYSELVPAGEYGFIHAA
jgi:hypothetical protein